MKWYFLSIVDSSWECGKISPCISSPSSSPRSLLLLKHGNDQKRTFLPSRLHATNLSASLFPSQMLGWETPSFSPSWATLPIQESQRFSPLFPERLALLKSASFLCGPPLPFHWPHPLSSQNELNISLNKYTSVKLHPICCLNLCPSFTVKTFWKRLSHALSSTLHLPFNPQATTA